MGSQFARAVAEEAADVIVSTRSAAKLESLAAELRGHGVRATGIAADFTVDADIDRMARDAWEAFGGIDVVMLSSQPAEPRMGDLLSTSDEDWREQQRPVVWGPFRLLKHLAPRMSAAGGGGIITLVSSTGEEPAPGYGAYGLAKGGLCLLSRYMAAEWGRLDIRVNSICPGMIATGGTEVASADAPPLAMLARTALGRVGRNDEVTGAAVYLASDESSFTTGQCIRVNGGRI